MELRDKLVVVTGASSGIGAATARAMARRGARVALLARSREPIERLAAEIGAAGGEARAVPVDLADPAAARDAAAAVVRDLGVPDVLFNNAGSGRWLATEETTPEEAAEMIALPYLAAFAMTRAFLPGMLARRSGAIVNMTSAVGFVGLPGATAYGAARWAMRGFTEMLRADLADTGIVVTLIAPGKVASPYFEHNPGSEAHIPGITRVYPTLTCDEVAAAVVRAVEHRRRVVVIPFLLRLTVLTHRVLPAPIEWLLRATGWNRSRA
ncbi:MAG: SDR family NAD(P)-dependent oxidoreductase [Acidobacteria bacterium]|nr:SDR family NAD(P)-dependent oxidoreductase [Acidobacteriota bacterium]